MLILCRTWIGAGNTNAEYKNQSQHVAQGTCTWILETDEYKKFLDTSQRKHLWVHGIPGITPPVTVTRGDLKVVGAGKSVLCSFIITLMKENHRTELKVLFFFCKDDSTPAAIMSSLIDQLIEGNCLQSLLNILKEERNARAKSEKCTDFMVLWNIFVKMVNVLPTPIFVVLDALDECRKQDRPELLRQILSADGNIRFFLTSRKEFDIFDAFQGHSRIIQCSMAVDADIAQFVLQRVEQLDNLKNSHFKKRIIDEVPGKSRGMFQYAELLLRELNTPSKDDIPDLLDSPPIGLNKMYQRIIQRLDSSDTNPRHGEMLKTILWVVAVVCRTLTVTELAYMCAVNPSDTSFNPANRTLAK